MPSHVFDVTWSRNGERISRSTTITTPGEKNVDIALTAGQTDKLYTLAIDVSEMKALVIDSPAAITIKTNSTSTPDQTLTVDAGVPLVWHAETGLPNPITDDVTALYFSTTSTSAVAAKFRCLEDIS